MKISIHKYECFKRKLFFCLKKTFRCSVNSLLTFTLGGQKMELEKITIAAFHFKNFLQVGRDSSNA
jgi:hypothetical protein